MITQITRITTTAKKKKKTLKANYLTSLRKRWNTNPVKVVVPNLFGNRDGFRGR